MNNTGVTDGYKTITINCGDRNDNSNKNTGGSSGSPHLSGIAALMSLTLCKK
jgi:hypothetical protein